MQNDLDNFHFLPFYFYYVVLLAKNLFILRHQISFSPFMVLPFKKKSFFFNKEKKMFFLFYLPNRIFYLLKKQKIHFFFLRKDVAKQNLTTNTNIVAFLILIGVFVYEKC